ncbi:MAG: hypothetical protein ACJ74G_16070 [Blastocatellia bacterium]
MSLTDELNEQVIYAYTDDMALDDGVLVDISSLGLSFESKPINRITATLFWQERPKYALSEEQLTEHLANCGDDEEPINFDLEAFGKAIAAQLPTAGGSDYLRTLPGPIWLIENEVNGWTLIMPSDY